MNAWKVLRLTAMLALVPVAAHAEHAPTLDAVEITPRLPSDADEVRLLLRGQIGQSCTYLDFPEVLEAPGGGPGTPVDVEHLILVRGQLQQFSVLCPAGGWSDEVRIGTLGLIPGRYRVEVVVIDTSCGILPPCPDIPVAEVRFEVEPSEQALVLQNGDVVISARWVGGPAAGHSLPAVAQAKESGYFWSFGSGNVELTAKVLDGSSVNGSLWLFLAPMSTLGLEVTVYDARNGCVIPACPTETYQIPPGVPHSVIDINALDGALP